MSSLEILGEIYIFVCIKHDTFPRVTCDGWGLRDEIIVEKIIIACKYFMQITRVEKSAFASLRWPR